MGRGAHCRGMGSTLRRETSRKGGEMTDEASVSLEMCERTHKNVDARMERQDVKLDRLFYLQLTNLLGVVAALGGIITAIVVGVVLSTGGL